MKQEKLCRACLLMVILIPSALKSSLPYFIPSFSTLGSFNVIGVGNEILYFISSLWSHDCSVGFKKVGHGTLTVKGKLSVRLSSEGNIKFTA